MQYVTTVNSGKTYLPNQVIAPHDPVYDGYYVPGHIPELSLNALHGLSSNDAIAHVLNLFFSTHLTGRDIDLAIGKFPVRLLHMNHRITVVESWHNLDWNFDRMVKNLTAHFRGSRDTEQPIDIWPSIAVRIAVICGAYTQMLNQSAFFRDDTFDMVIPSGDFSCAISAWYCKQMGLPIHNIVICCNENNNLWDFFNHGELRTSRPIIPTNTPECDKSVAEFMEMLLFTFGGVAEVMRFRNSCFSGRTYFLPEEILKQMKQGFYVSVIGQARTEATIQGAYSTHGYILGPYSALTYAGALDYRARTGENRHIMLLSEKGAMLHDAYVAESLAMNIADLHNILDS